MKRPFSTLSPKEALHVAIFIEERNADLYDNFADLFAEFGDPESREIATVFEDMAEEERQHGTELQERYFDRFGTAPCAVTDDEIRDIIEMPRLANGELFALSRGNLGMAPRHKAIEVALNAERTALRYYARLAEITSDKGLRPLYIELANFEHDHVAFLERKMEQARKASTGEQA